MHSSALIVLIAVAVVSHSAAVSAQLDSSDADGDGLSDALELSVGLDPHTADSDNDGIKDGVEGASLLEGSFFGERREGKPVGMDEAV